MTAPPFPGIVTIPGLPGPQSGRAGGSIRILLRLIRTHARCRVLLALAAALATGCVPALQHYPPLPRIDNPAAYLQALADRRQHVPRLSGIVKLSVSGARFSRSTKNIIFAEHPHLLRIEILGLFNQPAAYICADNQSLQLYLLDDNTLYTGAATADNIAAITGLHLAPADIVQALRGVPPVFAAGEPHAITCVQERSEYVFTITTPGTIRTLVIEPSQQKIIRSQRISNGLPQFDIEFFDFNLLYDIPLPSRISFYSHTSGLSVRATLSAVQTDPFPKDMFTFAPPSTARRMPLEALWEQPLR